MTWAERVRAGSYVLTGAAGYLACVFFPPGLIALGLLVLALACAFSGGEARSFAASALPAARKALAALGARLWAIWAIEPKPATNEPKPVTNQPNRPKPQNLFANANTSIFSNSSPPELRADPVTNLISPVVTEQPESRPPLQPHSFQKAAGNILGFILHYWKPVALIVLALLLISAFRGCARLPFGESREHAQMRAELADAELRTQQAVNARDAIIAQAALEAATHRAMIESLLEQGHNEIAAAAPANESALDPGLVSAWRCGIVRLRDHPDSDGSSSDSCGASA